MLSKQKTRGESRIFEGPPSKMGGGGMYFLLSNMILEI